MGVIRKTMRPRDFDSESANASGAPATRPAGSCPYCWRARQANPKHSLGWLVPVPVFLEHGNFTEEICKKWTCDTCGRVPFVPSKSTGRLVPMLSTDAYGLPVFEADRFPVVKKYKLHPHVVVERILKGPQRYFALAELGGLFLSVKEEQAFYEPANHRREDDDGPN